MLLKGLIEPLECLAPVAKTRADQRQMIGRYGFVTLPSNKPLEDFPRFGLPTRSGQDVA